MPPDTLAAALSTGAEGAPTPGPWWAAWTLSLLVLLLPTAMKVGGVIQRRVTERRGEAATSQTRLLDVERQLAEAGARLAGAEAMLAELRADLARAEAERDRHAARVEGLREYAVTLRLLIVELIGRLRAHGDTDLPTIPPPPTP